MSRDPLADVLAEHEYDVRIAGTVKPACKCGWEAPKEWSGVEVYDEHVAAAVRAFLTSDETVERVAFAIFAEHEPAFAHQEKRTRLWHALLDQFRADARAALAAATEARP